jgi:hypothetical protein
VKLTPSFFTENLQEPFETWGFIVLCRVPKLITSATKEISNQKVWS